MRAMRAGFQVHVAKPVNPDELVAVVAALGGQDGAGRRGLSRPRERRASAGRRPACATPSG